jgi:hypothetical protein
VAAIGAWGGSAAAASTTVVAATTTASAAAGDGEDLTAKAALAWDASGEACAGLPRSAVSSTAGRRQVAVAAGPGLGLGPAAAADRAGLRDGILAMEPTGQAGTAARLVGSVPATIAAPAASARDQHGFAVKRDT